MKILLSNDDGYLAPGIQALRENLSGRGHDIWLVAPDRNRSGASNSLTLELPLRVHPAGERTWSVSGTPTDCILVGTTGLLEQEPDMVVSGINHGPNLGDDVLYSGTVAAAMEGRFLGYPAIAVSLASHEAVHYPTAVRVMETLLARMETNPIASDAILNINVPDLPWEDLKGWRITRLGSRHKSEPVIVSSDPRGRPIYWIGPPGEERRGSPDSDFQAVADGYVSITPLKVDLTRYDLLETLETAVGDLR
jgi:5'-nucleotidase